MDDKFPYYILLGWFSPEQLDHAAKTSARNDGGLASLLSALAFIRSKNDGELEGKFLLHCQAFLEQFPEVREAQKRYKAKYN